MNVPRSNVVQTIMAGLILAGVAGVFGLSWQTNREQAQATADQNVALARLQVQVSQLQASLVGVPDLVQRVTKLETNQLELLRRQNGDEQRWEQLQTEPRGRP